MGNIGYIRVSHDEQNLDRQTDLMEKIGIKKFFSDKASGKDTKRPGFVELMAYLREGDSLHVESISRLSRSTRDFLNTVHDLSERGIELVSHKEKIDTSSPTGKFMLIVLSALYELERDNTRQRQREGIDAAKRRGKHLGRPPLEKPANWEEIMTDLEAGRIRPKEAMSRSGLKRSSYYNLFKAETSASSS